MVNVLSRLATLVGFMQGWISDTRARDALVLPCLFSMLALDVGSYPQVEEFFSENMPWHVLVGHRGSLWGPGRLT